MTKRFSRRSLRSLALAVLAGAGLLAGGTLQAGSVHADVIWCLDDPVISVNGHHVSITVGIAGAPATVRNGIKAADITVHVPRNASIELLSSSSDYMQENVRFVRDLGHWTAGKALPLKVQARFERPAGATTLHSQLEVAVEGSEKKVTTQGRSSDRLDKTIQDIR